MSKYEYEKPVLNETFDQCAAHVLRECMRHYEEAPAAVKDILENVAINQRHGGPFTDPFGYFDQTEKKVYPTKAAAEMMGCIESELVPIYATRVPEGRQTDPDASDPQTKGSWEERCAALYQVIGALASYSGIFSVSDDVADALDVAAGDGDVEKLLPWPKDMKLFTALEEHCKGLFDMNNSTPEKK